MKRAKDLSEAEFIINLNQNFVTNQDIREVYEKIEANKNGLDDPFSDEDVVKIVHYYLTFFETINYLVKRRVLNFDMLDNIFAYRFFIAVHNRHIQSRELIKDDKYYRNIYVLHKSWIAYRKKKCIEIPHGQFSLDLMNDNYHKLGI